MNAPLPLAGTVVLDVSRMLPGPILSRNLVDLGARVIKIEDPHSGDPMRITPPLVGRHRGRVPRLLPRRRVGGARPEGARRRRRAPENGTSRGRSRRELPPWNARQVGSRLRPARRPESRARRRLPLELRLGGPGRGSDRARPELHGDDGLPFGAPPGDLPRVQVADVSAGLLALSSTLAALLLKHRTGRGLHVDQPSYGTARFLTWSFAEVGAGAGASSTESSREVSGYRTHACADGAGWRSAPSSRGSGPPSARWRGCPSTPATARHGREGPRPRRGSPASSSPRSRADRVELARALGIPPTPVNDLALGATTSRRAWNGPQCGAASWRPPAPPLPGLRRPLAPAPASAPTRRGSFTSSDSRRKRSPRSWTDGAGSTGGSSPVRARSRGTRRPWRGGTPARAG
ncbi:MAG: CoA transferase [Holophagales bacterium]|nr:CoA transferase [Holophagales bacterium]